VVPAFRPAEHRGSGGKKPLEIRSLHTWQRAMAQLELWPPPSVTSPGRHACLCMRHCSLNICDLENISTDDSLNQQSLLRNAPDAAPLERPIAPSAPTNVLHPRPSFYTAELRHQHYAIVVAAMGQCELAAFVRRLLHHPEFDTFAKRACRIFRIAQRVSRGGNYGDNKRHLRSGKSSTETAFRDSTGTPFAMKITNWVNTIALRKRSCSPNP
jgi:hypothetical protein